MIRIKCPKCANSLSIPDAQGGGVGACPKCGQKFRVPAAATKSADPSAPDDGPPSRPTSAKNVASAPKSNRIQAVDAPASRGAKSSPRQRPADEEAAQGYGVGPAHETAPPPKSIEKKRPVEDDLAGREEQEEDLQATTPRRKKRKRKKKQESAGPKAAHIGLIVAGLFVVAAATGLLFWIRPGSPKAPPDPGPVLAELQEVHAAIEYDKKSPENPVVGISLSGCTFKPSLLGRLVVFPKLRKLNLGGTLTSDINLEWLEDVKTLHSLDLGHTKVTGGGMQFLKNMVDLEELNLNQTLVDEVRLGELKGLKKLKKIYLDGTLASGLVLKESNPGLEIIR
jgi:hypothetical protein